MLCMYCTGFILTLIYCGLIHCIDLCTLRWKHEELNNISHACTSKIYYKNNLSVRKSNLCKTMRYILIFSYDANGVFSGLECFVFSGIVTIFVIFCSHVENNFPFCVDVGDHQRTAARDQWNVWICHICSRWAIVFKVTLPSYTCNMYGLN